MSILRPMIRPPRNRHKKKGRPIHAADIPFDNTRQIELLQRFYDAVKPLTHKEINSLAVTLSRHRVTIERWKYQVCNPDPFTMLDVIDWVQRGKPSKRTPQDSIQRNVM